MLHPLNPIELPSPHTGSLTVWVWVGVCTFLFQVTGLYKYVYNIWIYNFFGYMFPMYVGWYITFICTWEDPFLMSITIVRCLRFVWHASGDMTFGPLIGLPLVQTPPRSITVIYICALHFGIKATVPFWSGYAYPEWPDVTPHWTDHVTAMWPIGLQSVLPPDLGLSLCLRSTPRPQKPQCSIGWDAYWCPIG